MNMFPTPNESDHTICTCECHENKSMHHCVACCSKCEKCGKRIITGLEEDHKKLCPKEQEPSPGKE